jgi:uncharacterized membrane protein
MTQSSTQSSTQSVEDYLAALQAALKGAPQGLIADALADAEEHLRGAVAAHPEMSEAEARAKAIEGYGSPEEVAEEYRQLEQKYPVSLARAAPEISPQGGFFGVAADPRTYGALLYMLLALVTGVFYFTWAVTGISMSFGFLVLIIGIPFFLLFVASVRLLAHIEGRVVEALLGVRMPRRLPVSAPQQNFLDKVKAALMDLRTWSSLAYMLLMLPLGIAYFVVAVVGLALSFAFTFGGAWNIFDRGRHIQFGGDSPHWAYSLAHTAFGSLLLALAGVLLFFVLLHLVRLIGRLHG